MARKFKKLNFPDEKVSRFQDNCEDMFSYLTNNPAVDGLSLGLVTIGTSDTTLYHGLGRAVQGWLIYAKYGLGDVYQVSASTTTIVLKSSASVQIKLWVF